jgi:hypothetical protein
MGGGGGTTNISSPTFTPSSSFHRRQLGVATGRLFIALILVWLFRSILVNLSFVEGLILPDVPFTAPEIITFLAYLIAFVLLLGYTQTLRSHWAAAYPQLASLTPALVVIIYVILLSFAYRALLPIILTLADDPRDFVLALRVVLAVLALILLFWAGKVIYDALPAWLSGIRFDTPTVQEAQVTCLNCGQINPASMSYCGRCGQPLSQQLAGPNS